MSKKQRSGSEAERSAGDGGVKQAADKDLSSARIDKKTYRSELGTLQVQLGKLQEWLQARQVRAVLLLEGLGPAGKATTAQAIADSLEKHTADVVTLEPARKRAQAQWHFQRFVEHFPSKGRLVIFDGSWYHQPAIEHAIGISDHEEFAGFLKACAEFERTLGNSGIFLIKYWFSASGEEQDARFRSHIEELRKAKVLKLPRNLPHPPAAVHQVQAAVMALTNVETARWRVIDAEDKRAARLACMADLLSIATGALASPAPDPVADNI